VAREASFLVEEFINAITTQLDRVQDALRFKAVNRPLTYALKDIALDLQVFVDVDQQGNVRFRSSGPNETGASTIRLGFTTITRPMIEENTVSLAMTRSPNLDELGLDETERRRLEQFGVRNAAQLQNLGKQTGTASVSRLTGIPLDRLRSMLSLGKPRIDTVEPHEPKQPEPKPTPWQPPKADTRPPVTKWPKGRPAVGPPSAPPKIKLPVGTHHVGLKGDNLLGNGAIPEVKLNDRPLSVTDADDDLVIVRIPDEAQAGALEIKMPDGEQIYYELSFDDDKPDDGEYESSGHKSWEPEREY
jgi:hypothetical protein